MTPRETPQWQSMRSAQRDGNRILVTLRASEQGPAEVDTVRWTTPRNASEKCWIATDCDPQCPVTYQDDELLAWMPMPAPPAGKTTSDPVVDWPEPALESDFQEEAGSGI